MRVEKEAKGERYMTLSIEHAVEEQDLAVQVKENSVPVGSGQSRAAIRLVPALGEPDRVGQPGIDHGELDPAQGCLVELLI